MKINSHIHKGLWTKPDSTWTNWRKWRRYRDQQTFHQPNQIFSVETDYFPRRVGNSRKAWTWIINLKLILLSKMRIPQFNIRRFEPHLPCRQERMSRTGSSNLPLVLQGLEWVQNKIPMWRRTQVNSMDSRKWGSLSVDRRVMPATQSWATTMTKDSNESQWKVERTRILSLQIPSGSFSLKVI